MGGEPKRLTNFDRISGFWHSPTEKTVLIKTIIFACRVRVNKMIKDNLPT